MRLVPASGASVILRPSGGRGEVDSVIGQYSRGDVQFNGPAQSGRDAIRA